MKPTRQQMLADADFTQFMLNVVKTTDLRNVYVFYKSIRLSGMTLADTIEVAKRLVAASEVAANPPPWKTGVESEDADA